MQRAAGRVSWLGTAQGMENRLVPPAGIALDRIAFSGLRGKGCWHTLTGGLRLLKAFWRLPAASCASAAPTRCSAWAATSASRAA